MARNAVQISEVLRHLVCRLVGHRTIDRYELDRCGRCGSWTDDR